MAERICLGELLVTQRRAHNIGRSATPEYLVAMPELARFMFALSPSQGLSSHRGKNRLSSPEHSLHQCTTQERFISHAKSISIIILSFATYKTKVTFVCVPWDADMMKWTRSFWLGIVSSFFNNWRAIRGLSQNPEPGRALRSLEQQIKHVKLFP